MAGQSDTFCSSSHFGPSPKRTRNSLRNKRAPEAFAHAQLACLRDRTQTGYRDLSYYDESSFPLVSNVPRVWQVPGEPVVPAATRGPGFNVAGFLRHDGTDFRVYFTTKSLKLGGSILFFNNFCQTLPQLTIVVLNNASSHTSSTFKAQLPAWAEQGMTLFYFPPYGPERNRIETLWRCCKHQRLPPKAYRNFAALGHELPSLLNKIGCECKIEFA